MSTVRRFQTTGRLRYQLDIGAGLTAPRSIVLHCVAPCCVSSRKHRERPAVGNLRTVDIGELIIRRLDDCTRGVVLAGGTRGCPDFGDFNRPGNGQPAASFLRIHRGS